MHRRRGILSVRQPFSQRIAGSAYRSRWRMLPARTQASRLTPVSSGRRDGFRGPRAGCVAAFVARRGKLLYPFAQRRHRGPGLPRVCRRVHRSLTHHYCCRVRFRHDGGAQRQRHAGTLAECIWASEPRSMNVRSMIFAGARLLVGRDLQSPAAAAHSRHDIDQLH